MESPITWNRATHVISDALAEADRQRNEGIFGHSPARIIHDALEKEGLLAPKVEDWDGDKESYGDFIESQNKVEEQDGEQELPPPGVTKEDENEANRRLDNDDRAPSQYRLLLTILVARERQFLAALRKNKAKSADSLSPSEPIASNETPPCPTCEAPVFIRPNGNIVAHLNGNGGRCSANETRYEPLPLGNESKDVSDLLHSMKVIDRYQRYQECRSDVLTKLMYELVAYREKAWTEGSPSEEGTGQITS